MLTNLYIRIAELSLVLLLTVAVILAWREARSDRAQLQSQLAAANQALAAATARQQDRDTKLSDALTTIAAQKKAPATTDQLLAGIAREAGLTIPLTLQPAPANSTPRSEPSAPTSSRSKEGNSPNSTGPDALQAQSSSAANPKSATAGQTTNVTDANQPPNANQPPDAPEAKIPAADLRPLYNYLLDCKACQAKLTAAQSDLADEKSKTATLTKSRDDAVRAANGGSLWKRTLRAAKWFAIGAAAGAVAAKIAR